MSSSPAYGATSPSSPRPLFSPRKQVSFISGEGAVEDEVKPRTSWLGDGAGARGVTADAASATAPPSSHARHQRRLSEDVVVYAAPENTAPQCMSGNGAGKARDADRTQLHLRCPRPNDDVPQPGVSRSETSPRLEEKTMEVDDPAVFESPSYSGIGASPPQVSVNRSHEEYVTAITTRTKAMRIDSGAQDYHINKCTEPEIEAMWPISPLPLAMALRTTSANSTAAAVNCPRVTGVTGPTHTAHIQSSNRLNLVPGCPAAMTTRSTRAPLHKRRDVRDSNGTFGGSAASVTTQPGVVVPHVFGVSSPNDDEHTAESGSFAMDLSEFSTNASPLPPSEPPLSSLPPFNLPTQPSSPQGALPQTHISLTAPRAPMNLRTSPPLSLSSSVVMSASFASLPSPPLANPLQPSFDFHSPLKVIHTVSQHESATVADRYWEAPDVSVSTSAAYQALSPAQGRYADEVATPTAVSDARPFPPEELHPSRQRTMSPREMRSTTPPVPQQQQPPPQPPLPGVDANCPGPYQPDFETSATDACRTFSRAQMSASHSQIELGLHPYECVVPFTLPSSSAGPMPQPTPPHSLFPSPRNESTRLPPSHVTLQSYVRQMKSPAAHSHSFSCALLTIGTCFCALPFCGCLLLLGLHFWAVGVQEGGYPGHSYPTHVGSMSQRGLTFMLGTLLCAVVMGLGGGLAVYALLYRRAIRYQKCVFALCANLSYDVASSDGAHVASNFLESPGDDSGYAALSSTVTVPGVRLDVCDLTPSLSTLSRWHREVVALLDALAAPQAASGEVLPFLSVSAPHDPSPLLPSPQAREQVDRPFFNAVRAPGALTGGGVVARPFSATSEVCSIGSSSGPGAQRDRVEEVVLSRRPQHPADESRLHDVVTVVVCRFLVPPPLLAGQQPISKAQLKELESLSLEFHTRLRRAGLGRQVYMTECGIAEVVFSLNTVWPVQLLVANATAVALALAAQRELAEWSPKYRGQRVRWGVAVHRFRTVLRPARGGNGRLTLSFGTLEYDVARSLAQLAALCGYGVLCHADFFTDAMNEAKGLPVDYVMDCMQRLLLVYQLHDEAVPEGSKRSMADILSLMRGGRYTEASRRLKAWKEHGGDGAPFLPAAQHLLYVARFLTGALSHGERDGRYGTAVLDLRSSYASFASSPPLSTTAASLFSSFSEWLIKMLMQSYFRPPPIWEEDTNGASAGPQWHSFSSPAATGAAAVDNNGSSSSRQASPPPRLFHDVVRMADVRHGSSKRSIGGNEAAAPATPSRMTSHYFFPSVFSAPANAHSDPKKRVASPRTLFGNLIVSSGSDAHWLHSPLTLESSVRVGSNSLSLMTPPSALPDHWSARPAPAEHFPPPPAGGGAAVVSVSPASSRFSSTTVMTPVVLPQALQELQRRDPAPQPLNLDDAAQCANAATSSAFPNSLPRKVHVVQEDSPESPTLPPQSDSMQALHASAVSPIVPLPPGECLLAAPGGRPAEGVSEIPPPPLPQGGGARRARRKSSLDSRGSRSRGRSSSALPGTTSEEGELVGARVEAAPSFQPLEYQRGAAEGAICVPSSVRSAQSLTLSGRTQQRSTPYPTTLPLFLDSAATLPGVEDDEDDSGGGDHTNTTGGDPDLTSFAEVSRERSMTSVAQRSRSMKSVRAASTFAAVVCTRTRRITGDRIGMTQVFQGFHPQGYLVAIKQVDKRSRKLVQLQRNEIHLLRRLSHSNIVHFVGDWEDDAALCMAMEYACDTLTSVLDKFGRLLPGVVRHYVCGLLRALDYLHNGKGIVHRDVSPNNILITNASDSSQAKLIDFGRSMLLPRSRSVTVSPTTTSVTSARLSRQGPSEGRSIRSTDSSLQQPIHAPVVGTPLFMSPEACRGLVHPANDVWSVGVIMYLCLTGEYPYPAEAFVDPEAFIASVGSGRLTPTLGALPNSTSVEHDFIEQCLTIDYTKRPSAAALLNHPFIIV